MKNLCYCLCSGLLIWVASASGASAATFIKANNSNNLDQNSSWVGGTAQPGASDIAQWDSTVTTAITNTFGGDRGIGGITVLNPGGNVRITTTGTIWLGGQGLDLSAATVDLTLNCWVRIVAAQSWNVGAGRTVTVDNNFNNGATPYTLTKSGQGTLTISVAKQPGDTVLSAGTFNLNNANVLGGTSYSLTISGTSTIDNTSAGDLTLASNPHYWNADFSFAGTRNLNIGAGAVTLGSSRVVTINNNTLTVGGIISGSGCGITKAGSGTLQLNNANLFTGGVTINAGVLKVGNLTALGPAANATVAFGNNSSGKLQLNSYNIVVAGLSTDPSVVGTPVVEDAGTAVTHTLTVSNASDNVFAGTLQNGASGTLALLKSGQGTLTVSGSNTYGGATTVSVGTLSVGHANALGTAGAITLGDANSGTSALGLTVGGGVTFNRPFTIAACGGGTTIGGVNSSGVATFGGNITLNTNANVTAAGGGTVVLNGVVSGGFSVTKLGAGTVVLTNINTFSAGMSVSNGTLLVNNSTGSGTGPGAVVINNGAALGGTGSVNGAVSTTTGGHLAPGSSAAGILTVSNTLSVATNTFLDLDLNQPNMAPGTGGNDLMAVKGSTGANGNLTLSSNLTVRVNAGASFGVGTYTLMTYTGTLTDNSAGLTGWSAVVTNGASIYLYAFSATSSSVVMNVSAATIATQPASGILRFSAGLNAYVTSTGVVSGTLGRFYWGTNAAVTNTYSGWTGSTDVSNLANGAVSVPITGLTGNTTYFFQFYATNQAGVVWGTPLSFTTLPDYRAWGRKMKIPFTGFNNGTALTNFPVLVALGTNLANFSYSQFASVNGYDLRFTDAAETTNLNYEIESWSTGGTSAVWVQVPVIGANTDYIWAYWGNPAATSLQPYTTNGATWDATFRGVWHMTQTNAMDSSAFANNGVSSNNVSTNGYIGGGQWFNGHALVNFGHATSLSLSSNFCLSVWIKPSSLTTWGGLLNKGDGGDYELSFNGGANAVVRVGGASTTGLATPANGSWYYLTGTYDKQNQILYCNGIAQQTNATTVSSYSAIDLILGSRSAGGGNFFNGNIDEVRVESLPRSPNWIWACYQTMASNSTFSPAQTVASYPVQTLSATNIQATTAALLGSVAETIATPYTLRFYWSTNASVTNVASGWNGSVEQAGAAVGNVALTASGLLGNMTYYYQCAASNADGVYWGDQQSFTTLVAAAISNSGADTIQGDSARLNGVLSLTNVAPTRVFALWGTSNAGTSWSGWSHTNDLGDCGTGAVSVTVSGLAQTSTYYYICFATNEAGAVCASAPTSFTTLISAAITAAPATAVAINDATVNGSLTALNVPASEVRVYWGTNDAGASATGWSGGMLSFGAYASAVPPTATFATNIAGLTGSSSYTYRFHTTNSAGEIWSAPVSFTTKPDWRAWHNKMRIPLSGFNNGTALTNFPIMVRFGASLTNFSYSQFASANGYDLRFTDAAESTNLNYEIESWTPGGTSVVWVQVPLIHADTDCIWAYWGNPVATARLACTTNGATWDSTFRAVWHLAQPNATDSTVNGNHGTASGNTNATGIANGAQGFANGQEINCGQGASLNLTTNLTISTWFKATAIDSWDVLVGKGDDADYELEFPSTTSVRMRLHNNGGGAPETTGTVALATWNYVAGSYDGQWARIYLNGLQQDARSVTLNWTPGTDNLTVGHRTSNGGYYYNGLLDEVRVESVPRSANWIWACHQTIASNALFTPYATASSYPVQTLPASNIHAASADLSGLVDPVLATPVTVRFYWTTNPAIASVTSGWDGSVEVSGAATGSVTLAAAGLQGGSIYYYQCYVTNQNGGFWGDQVSFTTLVSAALSTVGASNITDTAATLWGDLSVMNLSPTRVFALWGPNNGGPSWTGWAHTNDLGDASVGPVSTSVSGLTATSTYYCIFVATNAGGTVWSPSSVPFTTRYNTSAYGCRMQIGFPGYTPGETLTNFPALVVLGPNPTNGFSYSQFASTNGWDLRFTTGDGTQYLNYEIEKWDPAGNSYIWVEVPQLAASTTIWAYWGNASLAAAPADFTTNGATWAAGGLAVWHLKEAAAPYADSTGNGHACIAGGVPVPTASGMVSGGLTFNGAGQYLTNQTGNLNLGSKFTLSAWVDITAASGAKTILSSRTPGQPGFAFYVNSWLTSDRALNLEPGTAGTTATNLVTDSVWHHVAATIDTVGNVYHMYVDGIDRKTGGGVSALDTNRTIFMGCFADHEAYFNGTMDEVRIDRVVRSSNWVWACWMNAASNAVFASYGPAVAPSLDSAVSVSGISAVGGTLTANLASTGASPTRVIALWGPVNAGASWSGWAHTNSLGVVATGLVSTALSGLVQTSSYSCILIATNTDGWCWSLPVTFTTLVAAVIDNASGADTIGTAGARLTGTVTSTNGAPTRVFTLWGTGDGATTWSNWTHADDLGPLGPGLVSNTIVGLSQKTTYFYRLAASNSAGVVWAPASSTFTTAQDAGPSQWKMQITFPGYVPSEPLTNFTALVVLSPGMSPAFSYDKFASPSGWDLQFMNAAQTDFLNYEIEKWDPAGNSYVWVQVPILSSNASIWAYWGNVGLTSSPAVCTTDGSTWANSTAVWHLKESGMPYADSTAAGVTMVGSSALTATGGRIGVGQSLNGSQHLTNATGVVGIGPAFTFSAWVNVAGGSASQTILSSRHIGADSGVAFGVNDWGTSNRALYFEGTAKALSSPGLVPADGWHHVAATVNTNTARASLYVDGVKVVNSANVGAIDGNRVMFMGRYADNNAGYSGLLDEVRIESLERSSNWVWAAWMNTASNATFIASHALVDLRVSGTVFLFR